MNDNNIEDLFNSRFKDAEATPSQDIWTKLESNLEKQNVEGIYQAAFQNAVVEPSSSIWRKIATTLAWRSFLTFKYNTFNIYYASVITAIVGASAYFLSTTDSSRLVTNIEQDTSVIVNANSSKEFVENENVMTENSDDYQVALEDFSVAEKEKTNSSKSQKDEAFSNNSKSQEKQQEAVNISKQKDAGDASRLVDWNFVKITGATSICKDIPSTYTVSGLHTHADIRWILPKSAKKNTEAGHNISIAWQESGKQKLVAEVRVDKEKRIIEFPVTVEGVAVPIIKGKAKVCQGMEKQLYYVDESVNKEISYLWDAQQNTIDQIGNKYINIDWNKSGKDTISVTKVNTVTGCKSTASIGVVVYPQPKIDFEFYPMGDNEYEFKFTESQRKGYTYEWTIEGAEYNDPVVTHTASGSGSSFASLKVTDRNGCYSFVQKEVDFNKNFIVVPTKFTPSGGKYFMPLTNADLRTYRFEIYNARNEKVWESTELDNGRPASGWDGKFRGVMLPRGKYMWKISATFDDGTQWKGVTQPNGSCKPSGVFVLEN